MSIDDVESVANRAQNISDTLLNSTDVTGYVTLSTCNRFELYLDADPSACQRVSKQLGNVEVHSGMAAAKHIYDVSSGLESMVVGEREIVGQVRDSLKAAREAGTTSTLLEQVLQGALKTSRKVAVETDFSSSGRSLVGAALDLAFADHCRRDPAFSSGLPTVGTSNWAGIDVLLVGTGAYAGATVSALQKRNANRVRVWSQSGRAEQFAASHNIDAAAELDLTKPDVVILCRGTGSPVVTVDRLAEVMRERPPLILIDLARSRDVEHAAKDIPGVRLLDLETIRHHVPAVGEGQLAKAEEIVSDGLIELDHQQVGRGIDPTVVGVRTHIASIIEKELAGLPASGTISVEQAVRTIQRLGATAAYKQSEIARAAARQGRSADYHRAAELIFDTELPQPLPPPLSTTIDADSSIALDSSLPVSLDTHSLTTEGNHHG